MTSFFHRTTKRRRRYHVVMISTLPERSVARHLSVLEGWELVPGKALTFLKVMSTFLRLKSLKRVSEAPLKYRRSRFLCDANATSTKTCPLARGVLLEQKVQAKKEV